MVFSMNKRGSQKALAKFGMLEGDPITPTVTTNPA